jgi:ribosomal protein S18 acetylase RimI-like enzyme
MKLYRKCGLFFDMSLGEMPKDCHDLLEDLPPGCSRDDKRVIGFYGSNNDLIGVVDIVDGYPDQTTAIIGFILIDPDYRRMGLGKKIENYLVEMSQSRGMHKLRLVIIEENTPSINFWTSLGYEEIFMTEPRQHGKKKHRLKVYEKEII